MKGCDVPNNYSLADPDNPFSSPATKDFSETPLAGALYGPCDCATGDDEGTETICAHGKDQNLALVGYEVDTNSIYYIKNWVE